MLLNFVSLDFHLDRDTWNWDRFGVGLDGEGLDQGFFSLGAEGCLDGFGGRVSLCGA